MFYFDIGLVLCISVVENKASMCGKSIKLCHNPNLNTETTFLRFPLVNSKPTCPHVEKLKLKAHRKVILLYKYFHRLCTFSGHLHLWFGSC